MAIAMACCILGYLRPAPTLHPLVATRHEPPRALGFGRDSDDDFAAAYSAEVPYREAEYDPAAANAFFRARPLVLVVAAPTSLVLAAPAAPKTSSWTTRNSSRSC